MLKWTSEFAAQKLDSWYVKKISLEHGQLPPTILSLRPSFRGTVPCHCHRFEFSIERWECQGNLGDFMGFSLSLPQSPHFLSHA